jgi:superfamily I DNA/RNA helicase
MPYARKAWADLQAKDGKLQYPHDAYVKLWQLSEPQLSCDYVLLDEAQDTNPVVLAVLNNQRSARKIVVGDGNQAIYEWRGAVNALDYFGGTRLQLSQSFRFGPAVAAEANKWLEVLNSRLRLRGFDQIPSVVCELDQADAVLCRTNATAIAEAMRLMDSGLRVAVVGKMASDLVWLADAAADLKAGRPTSHPDLMAFSTWAELQDHAENDPNGADLKVFVRLIDDHGPEKIKAYVARMADEHDPQTIVSTAHRTKGLEWDSVRIAGDFLEPKSDEPDVEPEIDPAEARLAYVAVTRARVQLDASNLAWVAKFLPAGDL